MKNFYLLKLGKSQSILNTSSQMLYKRTGAPREADTRPGKRQTSIPMLGSYFQPPASGDASVSLVRKGSWS